MGKKELLQQIHNTCGKSQLPQQPFRIGQPEIQKGLSV